MDRRIALTSLGALGVGSLAGGVYWATTSAKNNAKDDNISKSWSEFESFAMPRLNADGLGRLADIPGRRLVVNFWATWCTPCREEMPDFVRWQSELTSNGVQWVGIAIDNIDKVSDFCRSIGVNYPIFVADYGVISKLPGLGNERGGLPFTGILRTSSRLPPIFPGKLPKAFVESHI